MFGLSIWHILILLLIGFLLFGGRISDLMGAAGKSLRSKDGIAPLVTEQFAPPLLQRIIRIFFK